MNDLVNECDQISMKTFCALSERNVIQPNVLFSSPLQKSVNLENIWFSDVFRGSSTEKYGETG